MPSTRGPAPVSDALAKGPAGFRPSMVRSLREGALWVSGAIALVFALALASFDPQDPGYSYTGEPGRIGNLTGTAGAWLADVFYFFFGAPAFLFPVLIAFGGWLLFRRSGEAVREHPYAPWLRSLGFILTLATSSGLATLHFSAPSFPHTAGGILGDAVGTGLAGSFGYLGGTLLLLGLWFAGVSLFSGVSWLTVMDVLGRGVLGSVTRMRAFLSARRDARAGRENKEARAESIREEKKKAEFRPTPRIEEPTPVLEKS